MPSLRNIYISTHLFGGDKNDVFQKESRCIASLFCMCLGNYRVTGYSQLNINVTNEVEGLTEIVPALGIGLFAVNLDIGNYFSLSVVEKKKLILSIIMKSVRALVEKGIYEIEQFESARRKVEELGFKNAWSGKPKWNKSRTLKAYIDCLHEIDRFDLRLKIDDKRGGNIVDELVISEIPDELCFDRHLGKVTWLSEDEVSLSNKGGKEIWRSKTVG